MNSHSLDGASVLVIGAGIMGAGIAQVAALAGHAVQLHDARPGAAAQARSKLGSTFDTLVAKGRLTADAAAAALARITPAESLQAATQGAGVTLVIEAIVENLEAKRSLLRELESLVAPGCVLASNTSSISVTALAAGLAHPGRLVGMHFFNPVPLMKLVEVISGLHTVPAVADAVFELSRRWGKVPVHARSTPGFIVNRIARPYYAETLALLQEQAAVPAVIDACLRGAGFRMGPCELIDLIGHDTNFAVTQSVFEANFFDKRFVPSMVQREMVDGGWLGRKSGRGFYTYPEGAQALPVALHDAPATAREVTVHGRGPLADLLEQRAQVALQPQGWGPAREHDSGWIGLSVDSARLMLTDGRCAGDVAAARHPASGATGDVAAARHPASGATAGVACLDVAVFDRPLQPDAPAGTALAYAVAPQASASWRDQAPAWLAALGFAPLPVADSPGLVVARSIAMLINEAADAVHQGVCTAAGADAAMTLGVNYPAGPFEWLARWDARDVMAVLEALDRHYRGERYRISPGLRARAWAAH